MQLKKMSPPLSLRLPPSPAAGSLPGPTGEIPSMHGKWRNRSVTGVNSALSVDFYLFTRPMKFCFVYGASVRRRRIPDF
jgi:hypothetical protein